MSTGTPVAPGQQQPESVLQGPQFPQPMPPTPPAAPPPKRRQLKVWHWVLIALGVVLVIGVVVVATSGGPKTTPTPAPQQTTAPQSPTTAPQPTQAPTSAHHKVGEQVRVGDWAVTINSAMLNAGDEFNSPKAGYTYLVFDATFKNVSSNAQTMSTLGQITVKDSTGQGYTETIATFAKASPGGTVEPGGQTRGEVVFEVPTSQHQFTFAFQPDLFNTTQAIWDINV